MASKVKTALETSPSTAEIDVVDALRHLNQMSSDQLATIDHKLSIIRQILSANHQRNLLGGEFELIKRMLANSGVISV